MKRTGWLMEQIADKENLHLAFWKARKGKTGVDYVEEYRSNLEENLNRLSFALQTGNVQVGNYTYFKVYDPKERVICAARFEERVLHHSLMNVCHPFFENYQIFDSYASRKGKGTYSAIDRAMAFQKKHNWFLKMDVRKFFDSIDHHVLLKLLERRFKDPKLLSIFWQIIDSYSTQSQKGLPIGNLTSQYFANHYLAVADHFAKEQLQVKGYVRYMDDMVMWHNDKEQLLKLGKEFSRFISDELKLVLKPFCLNNVRFGLPFLGYVLYRDKTHLNANSKKRFRNKIKIYKRMFCVGEWTEAEYQKHLLPLLAFAEKADSKQLRKLCIAN